MTSPYLTRDLRTEAEVLEMRRRRDYQPVIDRHMNKPDATLWRAMDRAAAQGDTETAEAYRLLIEEAEMQRRVLGETDG